MKCFILVCYNNDTGEYCNYIVEGIQSKSNPDEYFLSMKSIKKILDVESANIAIIRIIEVYK